MSTAMCSASVLGNGLLVRVVLQFLVMPEVLPWTVVVSTGNA